MMNRENIGNGIPIVIFGQIVEIQNNVHLNIQLIKGQLFEEKNPKKHQIIMNIQLCVDLDAIVQELIVGFWHPDDNYHNDNDTQDNKDRNIEIDLDNDRNEDKDTSSTIVIKKPAITNPWHKNKILSPPTFNNKRIISQHNNSNLDQIYIDSSNNL